MKTGRKMAADAEISAHQAIDLMLAGNSLLDVRSEGEFAAGSLPGAYNLPILNNSERKAVGICYKAYGQEQAIALGHKLVDTQTRNHRCAGWRALSKRHQINTLFCWRGGHRSRLAASWLATAGCPMVRIRGGYKAVRRELLAALELLPGSLQILLIGGRTGSGKTELLQKTPQHVDLEFLANHRGSAFGAHPQPQPAPADFENRLAVELMKLPSSSLLLEDESRFIGRLVLPEKLCSAMQNAGVILLQRPFQERVELIFSNYILQGYDNHCRYNGQQAEKTFQEWLQTALLKIRKRLGGDRYNRLHQCMQKAMDHQLSTSRLEGHREWIAELLSSYYDPMYDYQLSKKQSNIVFSGNEQEILDYIHQLNGQQGCRNRI